MYLISIVGKRFLGDSASQRPRENERQRETTETLRRDVPGEFNVIKRRHHEITTFIDLAITLFILVSERVFKSFHLEEGLGFLTEMFLGGFQEKCFPLGLSTVLMREIPWDNTIGPSENDGSTHIRPPKVYF